MLRLEAQAKINWTLDILGRREDGYHLMDMLMQSVTLADEITLQEADHLALNSKTSQNTATVSYVQTIVDKVNLRASASKDAHAPYNVAIGTVLAYNDTKTVEFSCGQCGDRLQCGFL